MIPRLRSVAKEELKKWRRDWRIRLIAGVNHEWLDLYETVVK